MNVDVVMISGHANFYSAQRALRQGAVDYLLKPVEEEDLGACLRAWIKKRELTEAKERKFTKEINLQEMSPIEQAVHLIETNRAYEMSSAEAAEQVHLNPSYFSKLFKQTKGMTFTDYVIALRMREAVRLLEKTSLRMHDIADRLGYLDPAYFTTTFKKATGLTPSHFRKQQWERANNNNLER